MDTPVVAPRTAVLHFDANWCTRFFEISGDGNDSLHMPAPHGQGIVQGMAIMTKMSGIISREFPGYMVPRMSEISFSKPVHLGDTLTMETTVSGEGRKVVYLAIRFLLQGAETGRVSATLIRSR